MLAGPNGTDNFHGKWSLSIIVHNRVESYRDREMQELTGAVCT